MIEFKLKKDSEFIELNRLLKAEQLAQTGGHAKILISEGEITVNGEVESRLRRKLRSGDVVKHEAIEIKIV
ncbi:MAG: ribosome-associated protein [Arenicella sp.]|jgi:ribosome-associated protein